MLLSLKNYLFLMVLFTLGWAVAWWGAGRDLRRLMGGRFLAAFAVTTFAGFFAPNIWTYHVIVVATFLATVRDRQEAICRYVVMLALLPGVTTVIDFGGMYFGTYQSATLLSIAMLLAGSIKPDRERDKRPARGWTVEDSLILVTFLVFSVGASRLGSPTIVVRQLTTSFVDLLLPFWLIRRNVRSADGLQRLIGCVAFSAIPIGMIAIYESRRGWPLFAGITSRLAMIHGLSEFLNRRGDALRAIGAFSTPLLLALFMMIAMLSWLCVRRQFAKPNVWQGGIAFLAVALIAPQSRGVLVALVPALIVLFVTRRRYVAAAVLLAGAGVGAFGLFLLKHSSTAIAAFVGGTQAGDYYDYRGLLLHRGLQEGMKHWFAGQSFDATLASLVDITQGEHIVDLVNTYLTVFLLSGVIGLVPFVACCALVLRKLVARAPRGATLQAVRDNRAFLLAALSGFLVYIYSVSFVERVEVYFAVLLALARLCSSQLVRETGRPAVGRAEPAPRPAGQLVPA